MLYTSGKLLILFSLLIISYIFYNNNKEINLHETKNEIIARMYERRARLEQKCKNKTLVNIKHVLNNMLIDTKHHLSWCPVFKAASTTWMKGFAQLSGIFNGRMLKLFMENGTIHWNMIAHRVYPKSQDLQIFYHNLNQTTSFLIVRHPFERLLSAYRDKLEHRNGREYYYQQYGRQIKRLYHDKWLDEEKHKRAEPTFHEFLKYLHKTTPSDNHWKPIRIVCAPCEIHYDYIIKLETFTNDNDFMLRQLHLEQFVDFQMEENVNIEGKTNNKITKEYYSKISYELLKKIYELYKDDFILFDYSPEEYYAMTQNYYNKSS